MNNVKRLDKTTKSKFWEVVHKQFQDPDFSNVLRVRDAIKMNSKLAEDLFPFLTEPICISDGLMVQSRFDLMNDTSKFNFINLISITRNFFPAIPNELKEDGTYQLVLEAYTCEPPLVKFDHLQTPKPADEELEEPPEIIAEPLTPEFYEEIDSALLRYPTFAEQILDENFKSVVSTCDMFYKCITGFYGRHRSVEGYTFVARYVIYKCFMELKANANRLYYDAITQTSVNFAEILIIEVYQRILFNHESGDYQFEILRRLLNDPNIYSIALANIFQNRSPSVEGALPKNALTMILKPIVDKSPQLDPETQKHVLLHLRNQMIHNQNEGSRVLMFFLKNQKINDPDVKQLTYEVIEQIPEKTRQTARNMVEKNTTI